MRRDRDRQARHREARSSLSAFHAGTGEASDGLPDRISEMDGWYVRLTTLDGERIEASIVRDGTDTEIDGERWNDSVTYLPVDDSGLAIEGADPVTVRVREIYVY